LQGVPGVEKMDERRNDAEDRLFVFTSVMKRKAYLLIRTNITVFTIL